MKAKLPSDSDDVKITGKPDAGNPHVRFDEGEQVAACSLLYWCNKRMRSRRFHHEGHEEMV